MSNVICDESGKISCRRRDVWKIIRCGRNKTPEFQRVFGARTLEFQMCTPNRGKRMETVMEGMEIR